MQTLTELLLAQPFLVSPFESAALLGPQVLDANGPEGDELCRLGGEVGMGDAGSRLIRGLRRRPRRWRRQCPGLRRLALGRQGAGLRERSAAASRLGSASWTQPPNIDIHFLEPKRAEPLDPKQLVCKGSSIFLPLV